MRFYSPPRFLKPLLPGVTWQMTNTEKIIYLSFDDGPSATFTKEILDVLSEWNAKATFFCLGKQAEKHTDVFNKILTSGHTVGNHTYSHLNGWRTTPEKYLEDITKCENVFFSGLFRPPYGHLPLFGLSEIRKKFRIIMWSLLSYDFDATMTPEKITNVFFRKGAPGQIWVFHDNEAAAATCMKVLPTLLEEFYNRGYAFKGM